MSGYLTWVCCFVDGEQFDVFVSQLSQAEEYFYGVFPFLSYFYFYFHFYYCYY